jgi:hypothetical protein
MSKMGDISYCVLCGKQATAKIVVEFRVEELNTKIAYGSTDLTYHGVCNNCGKDILSEVRIMMNKISDKFKEKKLKIEVNKK